MRIDGKSLEEHKNVKSLARCIKRGLDNLVLDLQIAIKEEVHTEPYSKFIKMINVEFGTNYVHEEEIIADLLKPAKY